MSENASDHKSSDTLLPAQTPNPPVDDFSNYHKNSLNIIVFTCLMIIGDSMFENGVLLSLYNKVEFSPSQIMYLMHTPNALLMMTIVLFAYYSDRVGKKLIGAIGLSSMTLAFVAFTVSTMLPNDWAKYSNLFSVAAYGLGYSMYVAGWYALLSPIVPESVRGRFFGLMRFSWQSISILFTLMLSQILKNPTMMIFGIMFAIATVCLFLCIFYYLRIPEIEKPKPSAMSFSESFLAAVRAPGLMPFCSYIFLLMLFTGACPAIFGLLALKVFNFNTELVLIMGLLLLIGRAIGFVIGGKLVDMIGTRYVFLISHLMFGLVLFLFLFRGEFPVSFLPYYVGTLTCGFGMAYAASFISTSTEMLAIAPSDNKSVATALTIMLKNGGSALSGILCGAVFSMDFLKTKWTFMGQTLSQYDVPLLFFSIMIILLIVTLGLVPSVIRKANWMPSRRI